MVEIHDRAQSGDEIDASRQLVELITEAWPWAMKDIETTIRIIPKVQCHGQRVKDIDIVLLARLSSKTKYRPFLPIEESETGPIRPDEVWVRSLCVVIEVKNHGAQGILFEGTHAKVRIRAGGWHDATDQNEGQKYALKNYLEDRGIPSPWIVNLIWFRNLPQSELPPRPHNFLGHNSTWDLFLNVIGQQRSVRYRDGRAVMDATLPATAMEDAISVLTRTMAPTVLDRQRMDRLTRDAMQAQWVELAGKKQLIFRGRGGSGKTMIMLQMAWKLFNEDDARILLLTYNRALVADLRRLLDLIGLPDDIARGNVRPQTAHSYFAAILRALGILDTGDDLVKNYADLKATALEYIQGGAISREDIKNVVERMGDTFDWKYIMIDEAQDWPDDERDLLRCFFKTECFVIADGIDQMVRQDRNIDWTATLLPDRYQRVKLTKSLRMKYGLARFANAFAREMKLSGWEVDEDGAAPGGRVIVLEGDYFAHPNLHAQVLLDNTAAGNAPVDMLVCVPPAMVTTRGSPEDPSKNDDPVSDGSRQRACTLSPLFVQAGTKIWDGVSSDVRNGYPTDVEQLRIVQYDSCRGLEGWTVINLAFDEFFAFKRSIYQATPHESELIDAGAAARYATRWLMMPLTRAIDTVVIQVTGRPSPVLDALRRIAENQGDLIQWLGHNDAPPPQ